MNIFKLNHRIIRISHAILYSIKVYLRLETSAMNRYHESLHETSKDPDKEQDE